jgi:hypothetical protein
MLAKSEQPTLLTYQIWVNYVLEVIKSSKNGVLSNKRGDWLVHPMNVQKVNTLISETNLHIIIYDPDRYWYQHTLLREQNIKISFNTLHFGGRKTVYTERYRPINIVHTNNHLWAKSQTL